MVYCCHQDQSLFTRNRQANILHRQTLGGDSAIQAPRLFTTSSQGPLFFPKMSIQKDIIVLDNIYTGKSVTIMIHEHKQLPVVNIPKVAIIWDYPLELTEQCKLTGQV